MRLSPKDVPVGMYFLVRDLVDDDWSLWRNNTAEESRRIVDWQGFVTDSTIVGRWTENHTARYLAYVIRPENIDSIIMAARHLTTEQWYRFARRQSERQAL